MSDKFVMSVSTAAPAVAPLNMKAIPVSPPTYLVGTQQPSSTTGSKQSPVGSNAFTTPMINTLFQATSPTTRPTATGSSDAMPDTTRSGIQIARAGGQKLEVTVIDHPKFEGAIVSALGANGAAARNGLRVGDHIVRVNGIRARDHRTAMWLTDAAESRIKFSLADRCASPRPRHTATAVAAAPCCLPRARHLPASSLLIRPARISMPYLPLTQSVSHPSWPGARSTRTVRLNRAVGDVGLTLVNNTQAGVGVVVVQVAKGLAAQQAGLEIGHVILAIDGELAVQHRAAIKQLDERSDLVELTVASRKLTEANVLCQHVGEVPCEVFIVQ